MDPLVQLTIALSLAALLGAAAVHQLLGWDEWRQIVRNYRLIPDWMAGAAAIAICGSEALSAAALLWPPACPIGAVGAAALLVLFAMALAINLARGRTQIDCGCFGWRVRGGISRWMVVRNGALATFALVLLWPSALRALSWLEVAAVLACVLTLALLYPVLNFVLELGAARRDRAALHSVTAFPASALGAGARKTG